jgi:hypothetical protein
MSPVLIPFTVISVLDVMGVMGILGVMGRTCLAAETSVGSGNGSAAHPRSRHIASCWNAPAPWCDKYLSLPAKIYVFGL